MLVFYIKDHVEHKVGEHKHKEHELGLNVNNDKDRVNQLLTNDAMVLQEFIGEEGDLKFED